MFSQILSLLLNNKKKVVFFSILFFISIFFLNLTRGGLVIYEVSDESVEVFQKRVGDNKWDVIDLNKIMLPTFVTNGTYVADFKKNNMETRKIFNVTPFSVNNIKVNLSKQYSSTPFGFSPYKCSYKDERFINYSCHESTNQGFSATDNGYEISDYGIGTQPKPYDNGIASLKKGDTGPYIAFFNDKLEKEENKISIKAPYDIQKDMFDIYNNSVVYFNSVQKKIYIYENFNDVSPRTVDLKDIKDIKKIVLYKNFLNIYIYHSDEDLEGYKENSKEKERMFSKNKIIIVDLNSLKLEKIEIESDIKNIQEIFSVGKDKFLLYTNNYKDSPYLILLNKSGIINKIPIGIISNICSYKDDIYFIDVNRINYLYKYSLGDSSYSVIYKSDKSNIGSLNCYKGIYVGLVYNSQSDYQWVKIDEDESYNNKNRYEDLFPYLIIEEIKNIEYSYVFSNKLIINFKYDKNCIISESQKNKVIDFLNKYNIKGLNIIYTKTCISS